MSETREKYTKSSPLVVYKMLNAGGSAPLGSGKWPLPKNGKPGRALSVKGELLLCEKGLHGFRSVLDIVLSGLYAEHLYTAHLWGDVVAGEDKVCARSGRLISRIGNWNDTTARLFAADCAEHVLPHFEARYPNDPRPRLAIRAAHQRALGLEYDSAAESAAYSAAESAADSAAESAADSAAESAAYKAAYSAAYSAAESAADSAAYKAAESAERKWQTSRLQAYIDGKVDIDAIRSGLEAS